MEAFVSRKRRKISPPPTSEVHNKTDNVSDEDDSTDFKLAMLASLHPFVESQVLLDILLAHEGSVQAASASLTPQEDSETKRPPSTGYQSSLAAFTTMAENPSKKPKVVSKKGKTVHLFSHEDVAAHTPCTIVHNFLPAHEANALLSELLQESKTFERSTFKLFDNVVQSPHTSSFYVESLEEQIRQQTEYVYNGGTLTDVRQLTPQMRLIAPKVAAAVNEAIETRIKTNYPDGKKLKHQSPRPWVPNAAFVNCYNGPNESVGYHSDQLTYLGPRAVIGSVSLGVAREFRVRRIVPEETQVALISAPRGKTTEEADASGQISIHLPHNSLLVMHAEMQEEWKHSIAPARSIEPHSTGNCRINITYRHYKASMHSKYTPRCNCGVPTVLRVVQKRKENWGRYFWMCYAGNVPGKEGCAFFQWAEFDENGEPIWGTGGGDKRGDGLNGKRVEDILGVGRDDLSGETMRGSGKDEHESEF